MGQMNLLYVEDLVLGCLVQVPVPSGLPLKLLKTWVLDYIASNFLKFHFYNEVLFSVPSAEQSSTSHEGRERNVGYAFPWAHRKTWLFCVLLFHHQVAVGK